MLVMTLRLVLNDVISWQRAFELLSLAPATILDIPGGSLVVGTEADIVLIDPRTSWIVTGRDFNSLSRITPFEGQPVEGRAVRTIVGGADIFIR
jgi:dihydroorotase